MYLEKVILRNFRNIKSCTAGPFSENVNLFFGENGSGKTNMLEALGLGSIAKSCRGALSGDLVAFNSESTLVEIEGYSQKKKLI